MALPSLEERVVVALEGIAKVQARLLEIAEEARKERNLLADTMKKAMRQPLEEPGQPK